MAQPGVLIVLSGPSGTGKGTICQSLLQNNPQLQYSISATTRAPRPGEQEGINYWFKSPDEFQQMLIKNQLLEWAEVYGNYYGTPRPYVMETLEAGKDVVLEIDTQGALKVKDQFPAGIFIFILPPSLEELAQRIQKRGTETTESIEKRLGSATREMACAEQYHYLVVNDTVPAALQRIESIIVAEKCRVERNLSLVEKICNNAPI
ncbi:MAG TPA: guanylate kinase [Patescibacteria group bacterium]|nr:guanylate kinase [Patescibacteria group bacterium]